MGTMSLFLVFNVRFIIVYILVIWNYASVPNTVTIIIVQQNSLQALHAKADDK